MSDERHNVNVSFDKRRRRYVGRCEDCVFSVSAPNTNTGRRQAHEQAEFHTNRKA